jgi:hypothetical protein
LDEAKYYGNFIGVIAWEYNVLYSLLMGSVLPGAPESKKEYSI